MHWFAFETAALVAIGCTVAYVMKRFVKRQLSDALIFSLLLFPMLIYGVISGRIAELSGFGMSAKVGQTARSSISTLNVSADKIKIRHLTSDKPDFNLAAAFEACTDYFVVRPSQIPSEKEKSDMYIANVTQAVRSSIACGRFSGLVVLDDKDRYIGSYDRQFFAESTALWAVQSSEMPMSASDLSNRITTMTVFGGSLKFPVKRITPGEGFEAAISINSTIAEAFEAFRAHNVEFLVLTDALGRFKGIVRYRDVVEEVVAALMKP